MVKRIRRSPHQEFARLQDSLTGLFGQKTAHALQYAAQELYSSGGAAAKSPSWKWTETVYWFASSLRLGAIAADILQQQGLERVVEVGCGYAIPSIVLARQGIEAYAFDGAAGTTDQASHIGSGQKSVSQLLRWLADVNLPIHQRSFEDFSSGELPERALYIADRPHGFRESFFAFICEKRQPFLYVPSHQDWKVRANRPLTPEENTGATREQIRSERAYLQSQRFSVTEYPLPTRAPYIGAALGGIPC